MTSFEKVAGKTKKEINIVIGLVVGTFQNWYPVAVMEKWGKGGRGVGGGRNKQHFLSSINNTFNYKVSLNLHFFLFHVN